MADKLLVSTEQLENAVKNYKEVKDRVIASLQGMRGAVESMEGEWRGSASNRCQSAFESVYEAIMHSEEILDDAITELQSIAALARETEETHEKLGSAAASVLDAL